jgi:cleavage and polyadenylation specificity factor subunit 2
VTFEIREEAVGIGQSDSTAKYGIGESVGRSGEVLEDEYGIAVIPERFTDIVTGVDPSKFASSSGRIGEDARRGFGFGVEGLTASATGGGPAIRSMRGADGEDVVEEAALVDEGALEAQDLSEGNGIVRGRSGRQPMKVSSVLRRLEVLVEINYIPLEGRVDARAARQSVRALQPRQVVILGGVDKALDKRSIEEVENIKSVDEVKLLSDAVRAHGIETAVTPTDDETAELRVGHAAYSVRLIDTPHISKTIDGGDKPKAVELHESKLGECTVCRFDAVATGKRVAVDGSIVLAPPLSGDLRRKGQPSLFVSDGDVLLTDLRAEMTAQGMKAEYSTHTGYSKLVVNGRIMVTKEKESGNIAVEGPLCEDFYTVRSIVCGQFAVL